MGNLTTRIIKENITRTDDVVVKVVNKSGLPLPKYETTGAACMDIMSTENVVLTPGDIKIIGTG